ncbi:MAG: hypothetical protein ACYC6L_00455 [Anaerolineae bacterium]
MIIGPAIPMFFGLISQGGNYAVFIGIVVGAVIAVCGLAWSSARIAAYRDYCVICGKQWTLPPGKAQPGSVPGGVLRYPPPATQDRH